MSLIQELRDSVNKENALAWVRDLESGEYQQGQGFLARDHEDDVQHCCLGVACETAEIDKDRLGDNYHFGYRRRDTEAPIELNDWLFRDPNYGHQFYDHLYAMNDERRRSFRQIARFLRRVLDLEEG